MNEGCLDLDPMLILAVYFALWDDSGLNGDTRLEDVMAYDWNMPLECLCFDRGCNHHHYSINTLLQVVICDY